jgi:uncharacterized protein YfbU (UPF0304 family)
MVMSILNEEILQKLRQLPPEKCQTVIDGIVRLLSERVHSYEDERESTRQETSERPGFNANSPDRSILP